MGVLVWGGLNPLGTHVISYFLQEGMETWAVKQSIRSESEEEHEMFFGRNALFQSVEADERGAFDQEASIICILSLPGERDQVHQEAILHELDRVLHEGSSIKTIILVCGEPPIERDENRNPPFEEFEQAFIEKVEKESAEEQPVQLLILYTPFYSADEAPYSRQDKKRTDFAKSVYDLSQQSLPSSGVCFYSLEDEKGNDEKENDSGLRLVEMET